VEARSRAGGGSQSGVPPHSPPGEGGSAIPALVTAPAGREVWLEGLNPEAKNLRVRGEAPELGWRLTCPERPGQARGAG
jgi:hypothetical protein